MMGEMEPGQRGVSEEYMNNIPPMATGREADCHICLEKVTRGEKDDQSAELPCGHAFDKQCLREWLKEHDSCPVCREKLDAPPVNPPHQPQPGQFQ